MLHTPAQTHRWLTHADTHSHSNASVASAQPLPPPRPPVWTAVGGSHLLTHEQREVTHSMPLSFQRMGRGTCVL